jgi:hypothetical protein
MREDAFEEMRFEMRAEGCKESNQPHIDAKEFQI